MVGLSRPLALVALTTLPMFAAAQPQLLPSFDATLKALKDGWPVRVTIEYARCSLTVDGVTQQAPDAIGGMALSTFEYFARGVVRNPKAYVATSETHLIAHPRYGYVDNYVRLRIYEDDTVEIVARYLKPATHEVVTDETFYGRISNGSDQEGIHFTALR